MVQSKTSSPVCSCFQLHSPCSKSHCSSGAVTHGREKFTTDKTTTIKSNKKQSTSCLCPFNCIYLPLRKLEFSRLTLINIDKHTKKCQNQCSRVYWPHMKIINIFIYSLQAELENVWLRFTHNLTSPQIVPFQIYCFNTAAAANVALSRSKELQNALCNF